MGKDEIIAMLKRRGYGVERHNPKDLLVFPPDFSAPFEDELYEMLKKYSFRILIRDVIKKRHSFGVSDLLKYSTPEWVEEYISFLHSRGVVEEIEGGGGGGGGAEGAERKYRLKKEVVFSFGDTLEWFIARVFEKEFSAEALWGVRLSGAEAGGDYDVIASVEGRLIYVEVKSSPPRNVEETDVGAFLRRVEALRPEAAIFLEDTRLRMKDKIVPFFETLLKKRRRKVKRFWDETFAVDGKVYITNSKPDIIGNLGLCLKNILQGEGFWKG